MSLLLLQEFGPGLSSAKLPRNRSSFFHCCLCPLRGPVSGFSASMSPRGNAAVNCLSLLQNPSSGCCAGTRSAALLCAHSHGVAHSNTACLEPRRAGTDLGWAVGSGALFQCHILRSQPAPATDPCHGIPTSRWKANGLQQLNKPGNSGNVVTFGLNLLVWGNNCQKMPSHLGQSFKLPVENTWKRQSISPLARQHPPRNFQWDVVHME